MQIRAAANASKKMAQKAGRTSAKILGSSLSGLDTNSLLDTRLHSLGKFRKGLHALLVRARPYFVPLFTPSVNSSNIVTYCRL